MGAVNRGIQLPESTSRLTTVARRLIPSVDPLLSLTSGSYQEGNLQINLSYQWCGSPSRIYNAAKIGTPVIRLSRRQVAACQGAARSGVVDMPRLYGQHDCHRPPEA